MIACETTTGFGAPKKAGTSKAHGEPLGAEEVAGAKQALGLGGAFEVPPGALATWRAAGERRRATAVGVAREISPLWGGARDSAAGETAAMGPGAGPPRPPMYAPNSCAA